MQDIHGIRPPVMIGIDPYTIKLILIVLGSVFIIALLFFIIRKLWKNKKNQNTNFPALPAPLPPFEAAVKELEQLESLKALDPRLFYFHLTLILRRYIGRTYHINAVEMTTQEFAKSINQQGIEKKLIKLLDGFFESSDNIKYAGKDPLNEMINKDLALIKEFIVKVDQSFKKLEKERQSDNQTKEIE